MNRAIFLDRDGTINIDKGYLYKISDFEFIPGTKEALARLQEAGYLLIIITNQSGVARGLYGEDDVRALHDWLLRTLAEDGIHISKVYYCPHHPDGSVEPYRLECECRKPALGLFYRAVSELDIDLCKSYAVGDKMRDLQICASGGCEGYLLGEGHAIADLPANIKYAHDLLAAAEDIMALRA
ncbi:MAG: D-glycero-beta-D-manno-heptose 1,7-bisphosphate 7-phosphatase [Synergistaceae bacterium]|jgi:D-glycero-D-manno-heptose 1,7-bisphosphate phosphatase|nr:D-glycero-beta-D-manno-heptose 1,7-bisphosphate 7-phosphatase [Synergistaceae bacterium]